MKISAGELAKKVCDKKNLRQVLPCVVCDFRDDPHCKYKCEEGVKQWLEKHDEVVIEK